MCPFTLPLESFYGYSVVEPATTEREQPNEMAFMAGAGVTQVVQRCESAKVSGNLGTKLKVFVTKNKAEK